MITQTLSMYGQGAVTLPKQWRDQHPTKHFLAVETADGLLIKPIIDVTYFEEKDGTRGIRFPMNADGHEILNMIRKANAALDRKEKKNS
jgi:hypothetical protein